MCWHDNAIKCQSGFVKYIVENKICHPFTHGLEPTIHFLHQPVYRKDEFYRWYVLLHYVHWTILEFKGVWNLGPLLVLIFFPWLSFHKWFWQNILFVSTDKWIIFCVQIYLGKQVFSILARLRWKRMLGLCSERKNSISMYLYHV